MGNLSLREVAELERTKDSRDKMYNSQRKMDRPQGMQGIGTKNVKEESGLKFFPMG